MAFDRAAARAAGYSEEEIDAYLRSRSDQRGTGPVDLDNPPPPPPGNVEQPTPYGEIGTAALAAGGAVGAPLAAYGAYRAGQSLIDRARSAVPAAPAPTAPAPVQPVAPTAISQPAAGARTIPISTGAPVAPVAPVAPTAAAPAAPAGLPAQMTAGMRAPVSAAPRIIDTATDMVRKLALEKLLPAARVASPVGTAASILAPSPTGPMVPRSGPLRGSEINPATGTGWTREELAQYEAAQRQRMPR